MTRNFQKMQNSIKQGHFHKEEVNLLIFQLLLLTAACRNVSEKHDVNTNCEIDG